MDMAKATKKTTLRIGDKKVVIETNMFGGDGHVEYSGFGPHNKNRRAERRKHNMESKNIRYYERDWE
jgi:hypothetical protein